MPGRHGRRPRQIRLPSPFAQAVLVVIGAVALVLFVLQLLVARPGEFAYPSMRPNSSVGTTQQ